VVGYRLATDMDAEVEGRDGSVRERVATAQRSIQLTTDDLSGTSLREGGSLLGDGEG